MSSVTQLLESMRDGDAAASTALYAHLYVVNEGFLRIAELEGLQGRTRGEFLAYVGRVLRSVVIDHLRSHSSDKRGAGGLMLTLSAADNEPALLSTAVD